MIHAEDRDDETVGAPLVAPRLPARACIRAGRRPDGAVDVRDQRLDRPLVRVRAQPPVDGARDAVDEFFVSHVGSDEW